MSSRPFIFRIHAAEMYAEIQPLTQKERAAWILNFANDLLTLKPVLSYSEKIISEANDFIDKKREAGLKGGRPKKAQVKQRLSTAKAHPKPETETELDLKEEGVIIPSWLNKKDWDDFVFHRNEIKKPLTHLAQTRMIKKLDGLKTVYDVSKLLDRAISNGWQDIYVDDSCKLERQEIFY